LTSVKSQDTVLSFYFGKLPLIRYVWTPSLIVPTWRTACARQYFSKKLGDLITTVSGDADGEEQSRIWEEGNEDDDDEDDYEDRYEDADDYEDEKHS
jgi:hypothetical protein